MHTHTKKPRKKEKEAGGECCSFASVGECVCVCARMLQQCERNLAVTSDVGWNETITFVFVFVVIVLTVAVWK